jgi:hypothetical protein
MGCELTVLCRDRQPDRYHTLRARCRLHLRRPPAAMSSQVSNLRTTSTERTGWRVHTWTEKEVKIGE